ncbi:MAG: hypothetical protein HYS27_14315 [Deltaproteobacteria bacterium]|nr:hypothetical protein [Deltaproteobacteria bacterium]
MLTVPLSSSLEPILAPLGLVSSIAFLIPHGCTWAALLNVVIFVACALGSAGTRKVDADLEILPCGSLTVTFRRPLGERTVTVSASSVRALALVEVVDEGSTWEARLLFHDRAPLDLGIANDSAPTIAQFLQIPLERHPDGAAPYVPAPASATLAADA